MLRFATLLTLAALAFSDATEAQTRKPPVATAPSAPGLSAPRSTMAGAMVTIFASRAPAGARLAIARSDDPPERAIVVTNLGAGAAIMLPAPGLPGTYELRLLIESDGKPSVILRQPLVATEPSATLAAPERVKRGAPFPARGIGPNGDRDRVTLVRPDSPPEAQGPSFFPAENVESTLEAPAEPGRYELRYVMDAPLAGPRVLASRSVQVE